MRTSFLIMIAAAWVLSSLPALAQGGGGDTAASHFQKAAEYVQKGETDKAIFEFKEVLKINPNVVEAYINLGQLYAVRKDPKNSIKWLKAGLAKTHKGDQLRGPLRVMWARVALLLANDTTEAESVLKEHTAEFPNDPEGRQLLAGIYAREGKTTDALEQFEAWAKADPKNYQPHLYRGGVLADSGQFDAAIEAYRKAVQLAPDNKTRSQICVYVAQAQAYKGDMEAAALAAAQAIKYDPTNTDAQLAQGSLLIELQDYAGAEAALRDVLKKLPADDPRTSAARQSLLMALKVQNKNAEIAAFYEEEVKKDPNNAQLHAQLAAAYKDLGKEDEALAEYEKTAELDPKDTQPLYAAADIYQRKGESDKAAEAFRRIMEIDPSKQDTVATQIAAMYRAAHRGEEAIPVLRQIIEEHKSDPQKASDIALHLQIASIYFEEIKPDEAIAVLDEAKQADPDNVEPYRQIASYYADHQKLDEAKAQYAAYLEKHPTSIEALRDLSQVAGQAKDKEGALAYLKQALDIDPTDEQSLRQLSFLLKDMNREEEARPYYEAAVAKAPDNVELWRSLGRLLDGLRDYDSSVNVYKKILELSPNDRQANVRLAQALEKLDRLDEAIALQRQSLDADETGRSWASIFNSMLNLYAKKNDLDTYINLLMDLAARKPDIRTTLSAMRSAYERAKKPEGFQTALETLLANGAGSTPILECLVDEYTKREEYDKALEGAKKLATEKPDDFNSYLRLANIYEKQGQTDLAVSQYKRANEVEPRNRTAMSSVAGIYEGQGRYADAAEWYDKLCEQYPSNYPDRKALATCWEKAGDTEKAKAQYRKILEDAPRVDDKKEAALALYGYAEKEGAVDQFIQYYKDLLAKSPQSEALWLSYESAAEEIGRPEDYAATLQAAFDKTPTEPTVARMLVQRRIKEGNTEAVDSLLSRFIEANATNTEALRTAGDLYRQAKMADKAIATYQKALDILGEAAGRSTLTVKMGIGQAYMLKEDWQNGALWLEKAQEVDDARFGNAFLARDLGSCYEHLGRDRDALDQYQRAGRTNGGDPGTLEAIRRLKEKLGLSEDEEKQKDEGEE